MLFFAKAGRCAAILTIATAFAVGSQARADIILSEDFSGGGPAGWTTNPGDNFLDTGVAGFGGALYTDLGNQNLSSIITPTLSVVAGGTYTFSMDLSAVGGCFFSGDCAGSHEFSVFQDGNCINGCTNFFPGGIAILRPLQAADFTHVSVTFVASSDSMVLTILDSTPYPFNIGGAGVVDNILLTGPAPVVAGGGVPEPAAWGLMVAGFGLAGASLRRRRAAHA